MARKASSTLRAGSDLLLPLVVNPRAGRAGDPAARVLAALEDAGVTPQLPPAGASFDEALRRVVASGAPAIGVAGGDGSARAAARIVAGTDTALAILPTGTLNHFARSLGIESLEAGASALIAERSATVAVGYVDDEPFLNTATFGLYAQVVQRRERLRRGLGKWPAALVAFLVEIARYRPLDVTLDVDGERLERATGLVAVGIGRRSFPVSDVPSRLDRAPDLVVSVLRARTRAGLLTSGARTTLAATLGHPATPDRDAELIRTHELALASRSRRLGVTLDGEIVRVPNRVTVRIRPDALRVMLPPDRPA